MKRLAAARAVYGMFLLVKSDAILKRVAGERSSAAATVSRVLGSRHVVQAFTLARTDSRRLMSAGVVADVLHALSMVILAVCSRQHRQLATLDATVAGLWAVGGWLSRRKS